MLTVKSNKLVLKNNIIHIPKIPNVVRVRPIDGFGAHDASMAVVRASGLAHRLGQRVLVADAFQAVDAQVAVGRVAASVAGVAAVLVAVALGNGSVGGESIGVGAHAVEAVGENESTVNP